MAIIYKVDKRRNIPRWRSYERTKSLKELSLVGKSLTRADEININATSSLFDEKNAWEKNKNIITAGNLMSSAFVLNIQSEFKDVAQFILEEKKSKSSPLYALANKILLDKPQRQDSIEEKKTNLDDLEKKFGEDIKNIRVYVRQEPRNAIAWMELGRLYSLIRKVDEAKRCVVTSLNLEKNNRYIVRSASRFFHHFDKDPERALSVIRRSDFLKVDPWLISAEVAFSSILDRHSKLAKIGVDYLNSNITDFFSITELASSIGTLEYMNGKEKKAKQYFDQSLQSPNDNSLAQTGWIMDENAIIQKKLLTIDIPFAFEAKAKIAYDQNKFDESYKHALCWLYDEPFSTRPVRLSSYIAGVFLNKINKSVEILKWGLNINPDDTGLLNDLIYFLIQDGKVEQGINLFMKNYQKFLNSHNEEVPKLIHVATAGLIFYKQGLNDEGEKLYLKAIAQAQKNKDSYLEALAIANYLDQEIEVSKDIQKINKWMSQLHKISKNQNSADINLFEKKLIQKLGNSMLQK